MDMDYKQPITFSFMSILYSWRDEWNVITAVSRVRYYDWWALRSPELLSYDCWDAKENQDGDCSEVSKRMTTKMPRVVTKVDSAFNGIGVYRIRNILDCPECKYVGRIDDTDKCEHVEFNQCIGNVYIHPSLITETWEDGPTQVKSTMLTIVLLALLLIAVTATIHSTKHTVSPKRFSVTFE